MFPSPWKKLVHGRQKQGSQLTLMVKRGSDPQRKGQVGCGISAARWKQRPGERKTENWSGSSEKGGSFQSSKYGLMGIESFPDGLNDEPTANVLPWPFTAQPWGANQDRPHSTGW